MAASFQHDDDIQTRAYDHSLMKRLLRYVRPYKLLFTGALSLSLVLTFLTISGPLVVRDFIETVRGASADGPGWLPRLLAGFAGGDYAGESAADPWALTGMHVLDLLPWFAGLLILIEVLNFFGRYSQQLMIQILGQNVLHDLRRNLFSHLQSLPLSFFQKQPVGRLVTRLTNDINALNELFSGVIIPVVMNLLTVLGVGIALLVTSLKLGLVALAVLPIIVVVTFVFQHFIRKYYRSARKALSAINAYLAEQINGMREVQIFNREAHNRNVFDEINSRYYTAMHKTLVVGGYYRPAVTVLYSISLAMVIWFGAGEIVQRHVTLGDLVLYIQLVNYFYHPIQNLAEQYNIIQSAMASAERIFTLLDVENTLPDPAAPKDAALAASGVTGHVKFADVHFRYRADDPILKGITIEARPGEHIALVGHTGAGKSTCINLLAKFYEIEGGTISLDGVDLRDLSGEFVRKHIAVVHQDVFCFAGTVAFNISLGDENISREAVIRCARAVNAHTFIERLPDGYDTAVNEGGKTFSLGERQLLAFARALAFDPKILILDEATASIDTPTELLIQEALQTLIDGRTAIIIAHRLSTIKACDRIYVMADGLVIEQGTHDELLAQNGHYAELYRQQFAEQDAGKKAESNAAQNAPAHS